MMSLAICKSEAAAVMPPEAVAKLPVVEERERGEEKQQHAQHLNFWPFRSFSVQYKSQTFVSGPAAAAAAAASPAS
jgi:hypothetical protein